jgi:hypothetical protein
MPKVGKKHFAYTAKGMAMAKAEAKKTGNKLSVIKPLPRTTTGTKGNGISPLPRKITKKKTKLLPIKGNR